jgi:hypothetical protein
MAMSDLDRSRRFARRRSDGSVPDDSLAELHAELVLLREENARLKAAEHAEPDIEALLQRARALSEANADDAQEHALVEGLVIRESLLEICRQMERAMILFQARLRALGGEPPEPESMLRPPQDARTGHWFEPPANEPDGDSAA